MKRWLATLTMVSTLCVVSLSPAKSTKDQARTLAQQGIALLKRGNAAAAIGKLQQAEELFHAPTHLLYLARAKAKLGKLREAHSSYIDVLIEDIPNYAPEAFHQAQRDAKKEVETLQPKLALLRIQLPQPIAPDTVVTVDGEELPVERLAFSVAVTPGKHRVVARGPGDAKDKAKVKVAIGEQKDVELDLTPAEVEPVEPKDVPKAQDDGSVPVLPITLLSLGVVSLGVGAATGILTLNQADDLKAQCVGNMCPTALESEADDAIILGHVSTATLIGGGVLAALGGVLLIVDLTGDEDADEDEQAAAVDVDVAVTAGGLFLRGSF